MRSPRFSARSFYKYVNRRDIVLVKNEGAKKIYLRWFEPAAGAKAETEATKSVTEVMALKVFDAAPGDDRSVNDLTVSQCSDFVAAHTRAAQKWHDNAIEDKIHRPHARVMKELHKEIVRRTGDECTAPENNAKNVPTNSLLADRCLCFALENKVGSPRVMRVMPDNDLKATFATAAKEAAKMAVALVHAH